MSHLLARVSRRLGWALLVLVGVGTLSFFISRRLPGDPARLLLGPQARAVDVQRARHIYGLDLSLGRQYLRFWQRLLHTHRGPDPRHQHQSCTRGPGGLHLDLGFSYRYRKPVTRLLAERAPRSLLLALAALLLQLVVGLGAGVLAAHKRGSVWDQLAIGATLIGVSAPTFVLGLLLQYLVAHQLGWLPQDGYGATTAEHLRSLVLPALTLGIYGAALYARLSRDELSQALSRDHVRAARARGAGTARILLLHGLRNSLLPMLTLMVLDLGGLVGGAVVTEKLFRWPGLGALAVDAMVNRDGPVIFGTVLVSALAIVAASLAVDALALLLDPRLRRAAHEG